VFKNDPNPSRNGQITRATSLVRSALAFAQAIREDRLAADEMRGRPMCMNQYWWLFGVARVPGDDGGRVRLDPDARHIIVMCRGQIYRLYVLEESSNRIIDDHDLSMSLQYIVNNAHSIPIQDISTTSVGLLTTENQKVWSRCRRVLVQEGLKNGQNFGIIDSSLFVLCLDDSSPESMSDVCKNMICGTNIAENGVQVGTCMNRWYDKLAIIVCRNGAAGMNFEHTCTDGSVDIRMACDIYKGSILQSEHATSSNNAPSSDSAINLQDGLSNGTMPARWKKLDWDIPSEISTALRLAEAHLVDRIQRHQLETLDFSDYGKAFMTSTGFSPDAFFQMALHAAYYSVFARVRSGFEPVQMRQYLHGRTDVVRTTTPEAAAFARMFSDEKASTAEKVESMHRAADAHVAISKDCAKGLSHHRHLYVLHQMWKRRRAFIEAAALEPAGVDGYINGNQKQLPATTIFTDPGWSRLGTTILMGSNVDNPSLAYAGFGPPAEDGFTVCYFIRQDHMAMSVCSRNGQAKRFVDAINQTFQEIKTMLTRI
jgi:carnitine O-acetyltransferase